jgi:predicted histidine transporter YuiF (NhaC family)
MFNSLKEMQILRAEGKLHSKLINRIRMLLVISAILTLVTVFNIVFRDESWIVAVPLFVGGAVVGLLVFSRMNVIQWNEEQEILEAGRMDMLGYITIALYIIFEIGLRTFLNDTYPVFAVVFILATVAGVLLGRAAGTVIEIHRVFRVTHGEV